MTCGHLGTAGVIMMTCFLFLYTHKASAVIGASVLPVQDTVAFYAVFDQSLVDLAPGDTIVFDKVITNQGDAYNPETGHFQAPVSGTYVFNVQVMAEWKKVQYVFMKVDGTNVRTSISDSRQGRWDLASGSAVLHLDAEQEVWLDRGGNPNATVALKGDYYSGFSGFLLSADTPAQQIAV